MMTFDDDDDIPIASINSIRGIDIISVAIVVVEGRKAVNLLLFGVSEGIDRRWLSIRWPAPADDILLTWPSGDTVYSLTLFVFRLYHSTERPTDTLSDPAVDDFDYDYSIRDRDLPVFYLFLRWAHWWRPFLIHSRKFWQWPAIVRRRPLMVTYSWPTDVERLLMMTSVAWPDDRRSPLYSPIQPAIVTFCRVFDYDHYWLGMMMKAVVTDLLLWKWCGKTIQTVMWWRENDIWRQWHSGKW